ncbi:MAG: DMT family transporter [Desulfuromonadales bacterium]|nr:DMT family transporter [Desulfuromonadales bacterium]
MVNQRKAYIYALGAVLIWSTVASAFKISLRSLSPAHLLLYANLVSVLLLGGILLCRRELGLALPKNRQELLRSACLGLLNPFLYYLILFKAFTLLPAQEAQPLNYTWAITLSLLAVPLLKQRLCLREVAAILVSYSGVLVISTRGDLFGLNFSDPYGVTLALGSTVVWSLYWIFNTRDERAPLAGLFMSFLCALPMIFLYCLIFTEMQLPDASGLFGAIYVGCFEMGISFFLWLQALKYTASTARVSSLIFISPFISLILIHFLVGEEILPSTFYGLILIVAGLILQQFARKTASVAG